MTCAVASFYANVEIHFFPGHRHRSRRRCRLPKLDQKLLKKKKTLTIFFYQTTKLFFYVKFKFSYFPSKWREVEENSETSKTSRLDRTRLETQLIQVVDRFLEYTDDWRAQLLSPHRRRVLNGK